MPHQQAPEMKLSHEERRDPVVGSREDGGGKAGLEGESPDSSGSPLRKTIRARDFEVRPTEW
jgi:hypothetical protein